ncbi:hypothetical protein [Sorangium sp. So ce1335]|uniref:hypothetical protein n=1 Tax=Sorangium sp. So ce1335 TaxID=3133335 RepID=UPI003F5ED3C0
MGCGYDHDYLLPRGALPRFLVEMASVWPAWIAEVEGGRILRRDELEGELPAAAESGFVLHRDGSMRARFHAEGGFVDEDGSSPLSVWILGWDEAWAHADIVVDQQPPSRFLERVWDCLALAIAAVSVRVERSGTTIRHVNAMDPAWARASWPEILKLSPAFHEQLTTMPAPASVLPLPGDANSTCVIELDAGGHIGPDLVAYLERSVVRLLGEWHRIVYSTDGDQRYTMPPGDLRVEDGHVQVVANGRPMTWSPRDVPALFKKNARAR